MTLFRIFLKEAYEKEPVLQYTVNILPVLGPEISIGA